MKELTKRDFPGLNMCWINAILGGGITFIDSDDYIESKAIELLVAAMVANKADVVQMRATRILGFIKRPYFAPLPPQTITQPELFDKYYISFFGVNILDVWMCSKLYNIDTLRKANLAPSGFKMGEDLMFNLKLFPLYQTYTLIDYRGYNYRVGGLTSRYNPTMWSDLKGQYLIKRAEAEKHNYTKAFRSLAIELKNIFRAEITQRILDLRESDEKLLKWIENEICDEIYWHDLKNELRNNDDLTSHFIVERNAAGILDEAKKLIQSRRMKIMVKRLLMKLIK